MTPVSLFKSGVQRIEIQQNDVEGAHKESSSEHMNGEEFVSCSSFTSSFSLHIGDMHAKRSGTDATLQIITVRGAGNSEEKVISFFKKHV